MFNKKRVIALLLAAAMSTAMLFSACTPVDPGTNTTSKGDTESGDTANPEVTAKYPGTAEEGSVTINISTEPPKMFSTLVTDTVSGAILDHLSDGLVNLDADNKPVPAVAKDWTISEDTLVYTFNLRDDYVWTNGEKVTAHDFEYAFKTLLDPKTAAPYAYFGYDFKNAKEFAEGKAEWADVGVKAIDDVTFELTLAQPTAYILDKLAFVVFLPLNQKAHEEFGDAYGTEADKIVTNGAFTMESWAHESEIVLKKSDTYAQKDTVNLEKIIMKMIGDTNTAMNSFKSHEIDMIGLNGDQLAQMNTEGQPTLEYDDGSCWYFEYNLGNEVLANEKVRRALTIGLDTESFVKSIVKNNSSVATQFTPPAIAGNNGKFADEVGPQFKSNDIEAAKKLIDEAKVELGIKDMELTLLIDDGDTAAKHAAYFQESWQSNLGITVNIEAVPFKSRIDKMQQGDFQIVMAGWGPDFNDPITFLDLFETGNGNNHTGYSNPAYDELLDKVRAETDKDARFAYLVEAEKLLMTDLPIGPYYNRVRDYVVSDKLTGVVRTAFQDFNLVNASIK